MDGTNQALALAVADVPSGATRREPCDACMDPDNRHLLHSCDKRRIGLQTQRRSSARLRQLGDSNPSHAADHAADTQASAATLETGDQLFDALGMADLLFSAVGYTEDQSAAPQPDHRSSNRQERIRAASRSRSVSPAGSWQHEEVALEEEEGAPGALDTPLSTSAAPSRPGALMYVSIPPQLFALLCSCALALWCASALSPSHVPSPHRQSSSPIW